MAIEKRQVAKGKFGGCSSYLWTVDKFQNENFLYVKYL